MTILLLLFLVFCAFGLFCWVIFININLLYYIFLKVPNFSTGNSALGKILRDVDLGEAKKFYDLGSGNGKVISAIAKRYPNLECVGIEYNIAGICFSKFRNNFLKNKVIYRMENFFKTDIRDADIVYTFLFPELVERLENKFSQEIKKGGLVIANTFPLKIKKPKKVIAGIVGKLDTIYIYEY